MSSKSSFQMIKKSSDENSDKIFIHSVAATAFGLRSLLPLNVPPRMPLIYCKRSEYQMKQATIELDGEFYFCRKDKFIIGCSISSRNDNGHECLSTSTKLFFCDGAIRSNLHIFCNATRYTSRVMGRTLECYYGKLKSESASFIPVKVTPPLPSTSAVKVKSSLSFSAQMHKFLMKLIGYSSEIESDAMEWIPEALIMPQTAKRKNLN